MIAVIGATGFTGRRVVVQLCRLYPDEELVAVVRSGGRRDLLANPQVSFRSAELAEPGTLRRAFRGARLVVSAISPALGHTSKLVAAISAAKPEQVIFFSTISVFSTLKTHIREVATEAEGVVADSGLPATILRPTMVYGRPGDRNIERLLPTPVALHARSRPWCRPPATCTCRRSGNRRGAGTRNKGTIGRSYNLPGPRPMPFIELIGKAAIAVGRRRPIFVHVPLLFAHPMVRLWSATGLRPRIRADQLLRLRENKQVDPDLAMQDFGYSPREFDHGVAEEAALLGLAGPGIARE